MPRIAIVKFARRYIAEIADTPRLCAFGKSQAEAIGNLVMSFPHSLGLSIEEPRDLELIPLDGMHSSNATDLQHSEASR